MIFFKILAYAVVTIVVTGFILAVISSLTLLGMLVWMSIQDAIDKKRGIVRPSKKWGCPWGIIIVPGLAILFWYSSFVAYLIQNLPVDTSSEKLIAVHVTAIVGLAAAVVLFDLFHRKLGELYKKIPFGVGVGAVVLAAYLTMLFHPALTVPGAYWEKIVGAILAGILTG